jgi:hypothetical protein
MPSKPEASFPPDYRSARKAFIAASGCARADAISRAHMERSGPDGKPVFVDSLALGPRDAKKAVLAIANGVRASFAMSAALNQGLAPPGGKRLVLVHALDPFAFMGVRGDPAWSAATLKAIATEDLSRVERITILTFGKLEDELPAIFGPERKVRIVSKQADARTGAGMRAMLEAELSKL